MLHAVLHAWLWLAGVPRWVDADNCDRAFRLFVLLAGFSVEYFIFFA